MQLVSPNDWNPKVLSSKVEFHSERWDDPGCYPSGAGGGPLASRRYTEFDGGEYVVKFTDEQMSTFAQELDLVSEFTPMTADQVYAMSETDVNGKPVNRNAFWLDWINESLDANSLDSSFKTIAIITQSCAYLGNGTFRITIDDAEVDDHGESEYDPRENNDSFNDN